MISTRSLRRVALPAIALTGALVLQPLAVAPTYAGSFCDNPLPFPPPSGDCTPPETKFTQTSPGVLSGSETVSRQALFKFTTQAEETAPDGSPPVTFECKLTGPSQAHDWTDCTDEPDPGEPTTAGSRNYSALELGDYTFEVQASDSATDAFGAAAPNTETTPATYSWKVVAPPPDDTTAPQTTITRPLARWHLQPFGQVSYTSSEPALRYQCTLNGGARACSGGGASFSLSGGDWTFTVAATDMAGNTDQTPAVNRFSLPTDSTRLAYSSGWSKYSTNNGGYYMGTYSTTKKKGAWTRLGRTGFKSAVLVATTCPKCGTVAVTYNKKVIKRISFYSSTKRTRRLFKIGSYTTARSGRYVVSVTSSNKPVIIEGFGMSARP